VYRSVPPIDHLHRILPIPNVVQADVYRAVRSALQFSHEGVRILEVMMMPRRRRRRRRRRRPTADEAEIRNAVFEAAVFVFFGHDRPGNEKKRIGQREARVPYVHQGLVSMYGRVCIVRHLWYVDRKN